MLRVAVCDDQSEIRLLLEGYLDRLGADSKETIDIETFPDGRSLCAALADDRYFDLLFLDIELGDARNGLELCRWIREGYCANPDVPVIFISGKEGYEKDLIRFYPLYFLPKPFEYQLFFDMASRALKLENVRQAIFEYSVGREYKRIALRDVMYFESFGRKIGLVSTYGADHFYGNLDHIQEKLKNSSFLRIHQSYLINVDHVETVQFDCMILWNGTKLPISQSRQKLIRQTFADMKDE